GWSRAGPPTRRHGMRSSPIRLSILGDSDLAAREWPATVPPLRVAARPDAGVPPRAPPRVALAFEPRECAAPGAPPVAVAHRRRQARILTCRSPERQPGSPGLLGPRAYRWLQRRRLPGGGGARARQGASAAPGHR